MLWYLPTRYLSYLVNLGSLRDWSRCDSDSCTQSGPHFAQFSSSVPITFKQYSTTRYSGFGVVFKRHLPTFHTNNKYYGTTNPRVFSTLDCSMGWATTTLLPLELKNSNQSYKGHLDYNQDQTSRFFLECACSNLTIILCSE